jgi:hypothetical protein
MIPAAGLGGADFIPPDRRDHPALRYLATPSGAAPIRSVISLSAVASHARGHRFFLAASKSAYVGSRSRRGHRASRQ